MAEILNWDIYEITTKGASIQGVMLRGRLRKYSLENLDRGKTSVRSPWRSTDRIFYSIQFFVD